MPLPRTVQPVHPIRPANRADRLAELVAELTGCDSAGARHAVQAQDGVADPLAVVAAAMLQVDRPDPEGFRITGFLRDDLAERRTRPHRSARLPHRVRGHGLPHRPPLPRSA